MLKTPMETRNLSLLLSLDQLKTQCNAQQSADNLIPTFRAALAECQKVMADQFENGHRGRELVEFRTAFIDHILLQLWRHFLLPLPSPRPVALIAVGGYGRKELHPFSDIDLLLLVEKPRHLKGFTDFFQKFLTTLWDIGLEVGHSVRSLKDCVDESRKDITVATNLLESRLLNGPEQLLEKLQLHTGPKKVWPSAKFFSAKLNEQIARHAHFGDSAYQLEPNIKESPGGLRDLQMIGWVVRRHFGANSLSELVEHGFLDQSEYDYLIESQEFLWQVRNGLHLLATRKEDQLFFEYQRSLAASFGYTDGDGTLAVEKLMKRYFRVVMELSRFCEMILQSFQEEILLSKIRSKIKSINSRFRVRNGYLETADEAVFARYPFALLEAFLIIQNDPDIKGIRAVTTRLIRNHLHLIDDLFRQDIRATSLFMEILRQPKGISHELRRMNHYGVLARYVPAFGQVVGQMQHDLFHLYTVDDHTLRVVSNLRSFSSLEWCSDTPQAHHIFQRIPKPELLYLAGLFHDIGKGQGGDHSKIGAIQARQFCELHGLSKYDTALVGWLVEQHLSMSSFSQKQDIADPQVIKHFAEKIGDLAHLDYLYLLTVADMKGTSHKVWNSWKSSLLDTLYLAARGEIRKELTEPQDLSIRVAEVQETVHNLLQGSPCNEDATDLFFSSLPREYFLNFEPRLIAWHAQAVITQTENPVVAVENFPQLGGSSIFVYSPDKIGLFATITCELSRLGLQVVDAKITTTSGNQALDTFIVLTEEGEPLDDPRQLTEIKTRIGKAISPETLKPKLPQRRRTIQQRAFSMRTKVNFYTDYARNRTVMEIVTSDRPGLLARIAIILNQLQLSLVGARINTYGERAEDIFFILDRQGNKAISSVAMLDRLKLRLREELDDHENNTVIQNL